MDLTVVILTKNEETHIEAVIENAKQLTDQVLIVDSGSTDATVELAEKLGARVVFRAWDNDFSAQRNFALEQVATQWILYLDADERMNTAMISDIKKAVAQGTAKGYRVVRVNYAFGFKYKHGVFGPDTVLRMFPTKEVHWENKVHERPVFDLPEGKLAGNLDHYTYEDLDHWWKKNGNYATIWAKDHYDKGKRVGAGAALAHGIACFLKTYILQGGILDGWAGVYSSMLHFMYTSSKYMKLYELQKRG